MYLISCQEKPKEKHATKTKSSDSTNKSLKDTVPEVEIKNRFTKISDSMCYPLLVSDFKYTNKNTQIFFLNPNDSLDCFIFSSEFSCGLPSGSCGNDIQVFKKNQGKYYSALSTCGLIYNVLNEQHDGILSFIYGTASGYKIKAYWNGSDFSEDNMSVNDIDYGYVLRLSEQTHLNPTEFSLYDPDKEQDDKIVVHVEDFKIGHNNTAKIYTFTLNRVPEMFVFLPNPDRPQLVFSKKGNFKIKGIVSGKEMYDLQVTDIANPADLQIFQYDKKKKKYLKF